MKMLASIVLMFAFVIGFAATANSGPSTVKQRFQFYVDPPGGSNTVFASDAAVTITADGVNCSGLAGNHGDITCDLPAGTVLVYVDAVSSDGLWSFHGFVEVDRTPRGGNKNVHIYLT